MTASKETEAEFTEFLSAFERADSKKSGERAVLIVDDEPTVRRMVSRAMSSLDETLKVYQAENGMEALQTFDAMRKQHGDPVLIVTDLQMPIMDGWEFIDQLWKKFQAEGREFGVPLIVLSSSSGAKGMLFGKSVHGGKCKYEPLATIAKEDCIKPVKYDAQGQKGLITWIKHFLRKPPAR
jgi:CheY-like chemotaxis protein